MPFSTDSVRAGGKHVRNAFALVVMAGFALTSVTAIGSPAPVSLASLESRIPQAPGVLADESAIEEAIQAVRAARDETGLGYTYENSLGPADVIISATGTLGVLRFQQRGGVELPLVGSKIAKDLAVLTEQEREQLAVIALHETRRERLAQLRNAYVQYWSYYSQANVAQGYLDASRDERTKAEVLRRSGFWTSTDLLDFLNSVQKVQSESDAFRSSARGQLALVDSAVGSELPPFEPETPQFFDRCSPNRAKALDSAFAVDTTLAQYDAETVQTQEELARVHGSTINGKAQALAGSVTDINNRISGYSVDAGVSVSLPTHARDEERAKRDQFNQQLKTLGLRQTQRKIELSSSVDSILADIASSLTELDQAQRDESAREADLRNAIVRYNTVRQTADTGFNDVHEKRNELYIAQRTVAEARATLLLKANDLLMVAPDRAAPHMPPFRHGRSRRHRPRRRRPLPQWRPQCRSPSP